MTGNAVLLSTFIDTVRRRNETDESDATVQEIARAVLASNEDWNMLGLDVGLNGDFENEVFNVLITCPRFHVIALSSDLDASTALIFSIAQFQQCPTSKSSSLADFPCPWQRPKKFSKRLEQSQTIEILGFYGGGLQ